MKKRTKYELVVFVLLAISLFGKFAKDMPTSQPAVQETQVQETAASVLQPAEVEKPTEEEIVLYTEPALSESEIESMKAAESEGDSETESEALENGTDGIDGKGENGGNGGSQAAITTETSQASGTQNVTETKAEKADTIAEDGSYTDKDSVALYIATYGHLPSNFITKKKAEEAGWNSKEGNLDEVCPGKSIGGSKFGNYEGKLPDKKNRQYYECDINYNAKKGYRGSERIIYSNDGLVYYTGDHYNTFELLYGKP